MNFLVERTSERCDEDNPKPCDDERLVFEEYDEIEIRTCTEEIFNKKFSEQEGLWRSKGINHNTYKNGEYIQRTFPNAKKGWFIELNSLEELMEFINKYANDVVITKSMFNHEIKCIEIYDTWRE